MSAFDRGRNSPDSLSDCCEAATRSPHRVSHLCRHLTDSDLGLGFGQNAVQQDEVVDHPVVTGGDHGNSGLLEFAGTSVAGIISTWQLILGPLRSLAMSVQSR